ncbi:MAG: hypothetical protein ACR2GY_02935 [Phycisphaerales bacterium]
MKQSAMFAGVFLPALFFAAVVMCLPGCWMSQAENDLPLTAERTISDFEPYALDAESLSRAHWPRDDSAQPYGWPGSHDTALAPDAAGAYPSLAGGRHVAATDAMDAMIAWPRGFVSMLMSPFRSYPYPPEPNRGYERVPQQQDDASSGISFTSAQTERILP